MSKSDKWRVLINNAASAEFNMSLDEAIFQSFKPSVSSPVIRFYSWDPPGISIGRNQDPIKILDIGKCHNSDVSVVRRITGGGAIFHSSELTYSIVCSQSDIPAGYSVTDSFRYLTSFLLKTYKKIGLNPEYAFNSRSQRIHSTDFCYAGHERYDILINGKKLGGNAQRRLKDRMILHGSIPFENMSAVGASFLLSPDEDIESVTTSIRGEHIRIGEKEMIRLLTESFSEAVSAELIMDSFNEEEGLYSEFLRRTKYSNEGWNMFGVES